MIALRDSVGTVRTMNQFTTPSIQWVGPGLPSAHQIAETARLLCDEALHVLRSDWATPPSDTQAQLLAEARTQLVHAQRLLDRATWDVDRRIIVIPDLDGEITRVRSALGEIFIRLADWEEDDQWPEILLAARTALAQLAGILAPTQEVTGRRWYGPTGWELAPLHFVEIDAALIGDLAEAHAELRRALAGRGVPGVRDALGEISESFGYQQDDITTMLSRLLGLLLFEPNDDVEQLAAAAARPEATVTLTLAEYYAYQRAYEAITDVWADGLKHSRY